MKSESGRRVDLRNDASQTVRKGGGLLYASTFLSNRHLQAVFRRSTSRWPPTANKNKVEVGNTSDGMLSGCHNTG